MQAGRREEPFDRAAMIEAASRSLRQQLARGGAARDRPRSKGSLNDPGGGAVAAAAAAAATPAVGGSSPGSEPLGAAESAQRRIRSAENQHRLVRSGGDGPAVGEPGAPEDTPVPAGVLPASALDNYNPAEEDLEEDLQVGNNVGLEDVAAVFQDLHRELKRPLSRKKDPSASAAAGLGAFSGPARVTDAFEQRKMRQPIPVESWGPRPPSRAGLPQKAAPLEEGLDVDPKILLGQSRGRNDGGASSSVGRPVGKVGSEQAPLGAKVIGGTWAAARAEPRVNSETRRGRDRRTGTRGSPEVNYAAADLGIFGCGQGVPSQRLSKSLSGVFDHHAAQLGPRGAPWQLHAGHAGSWASHADAAAAGALEVSGCSLGGDPAGGPWPGSPAESCGSPPTRGKARAPDGVSVEDVEADPDLVPHVSYRRDATPAQVIVTRSTLAGKTRGNVRRGSDQRAPRFNTSLDVDFLSLFAS